MELEEPVDCIADFTYNFYWQHKGKYLKPEDTIPGTEYRYKDVVEHLKKETMLKLLEMLGIDYVLVWALISNILVEQGELSMLAM